MVGENTPAIWLHLKILAVETRLDDAFSIFSWQYEHLLPPIEIVIATVGLVKLSKQRVLHDLSRIVASQSNGGV